ncbi:MAG: preprotein translocase subunit SecG [Candidatus Kaistia colombiensis]|nr:MAG: preprotein translocase subunit SecG [Kaistia sp.]
MQTVIIVIHLMVVVALVAVVLLQRSEGGALGIGGGGGFMTARGSANVLTRTTAILAAIFFVTSMGLALLSRYGERPSSILDQIQGQSTSSPSAPAGSGQGILNQLPGQKPAATPAASAPAPATAPAGEAAPAGAAAPAETAPAPAAPAPAEPAAPAVPSSQ